MAFRDKKQRIAELDKRAQAGDPLAKHERDVLASGGEDRQRGKLREKVSKGAVDRTGAERIGINLGLIEPPRPAPAPTAEGPGLPSDEEFSSIIQEFIQGNVTTEELNTRFPGLTLDSGETFWDSEQFRTLIEENRTAVEAAERAQANEELLIQQEEERLAAQEDLIEGRRVFFDPQTQQLTNRTEQTLPVYRDNAGDLTFDPTPIPYMFGSSTIPQSSLSQPDSGLTASQKRSISSLIDRAPQEEISSRILSSAVTSLAIKLDRQGMTEDQTLRALFPSVRISSGPVYDFRRESFLLGEDAEGYADTVRRFAEEGPSVLYDPASLKPRFSQEEISAMGFQYVRDPYTGDVTIEHPDEGRSALYLKMRDGVRDLLRQSPYQGGGETELETLTRVYNGKDVPPRHTVYVRGVDGTPRPVTITNKYGFFGGLNWFSHILERSVEDPTGIAVFEGAVGTLGAMGAEAFHYLSQKLPNTIHKGVRDFVKSKFGDTAGDVALTSLFPAVFNPRINEWIDEELDDIEVEQQEWKEIREMYARIASRGWGALMHPNDDQWLNDWKSQTQDEELTELRSELEELKFKYPEGVKLPAVFHGGEAEADLNRRDELLLEIEDRRAALAEEADGLRQVAYAKAQELNDTGIPLTEEAWSEVTDNIRRAIELDRKMVDGDPYFFATWAAFPERFDAFMEALIVTELQLQRPLTPPEVYHLANDGGFTSPAAQLMFEIPFDLLNLAGIVISPVGKLLKASFGAMDEAIGITKFAKEVVDENRLLSWLTRRAAASVSRIRGLQFASIFTRKTNHLKSSDALMDWVKDIVKIISDNPNASRSELAELIRAFDPSIGSVAARRLVKLNDDVPIEDLPAIIDRANNRATQDLLDKLNEASIRAGKITENGNVLPDIAEQNARRAADLINDGRHLASTLADTIGTRIRNDLRTGWSQHFFKDSIVGQIDQGLSKLIKSNLDEVDWFGKLSSGAAEKIQDLYRRTLNGGLNIGPLTLPIGFGQVSDWARRFWFEAVLTARPAWTWYNKIDSTLRMLLSGGSIYDDMDEVWEAFRIFEKDFPVEASGGVFGSLALGTKSADARLLAGEKFKWGGFPDFAKSFSERWAKGGVRKGLSPRALWSSWNTAWMDYNQAMETTLRVRAWHGNAQEIYKVLGPEAVNRILALFPDEYRPFVESFVRSSNYSPTKLATIIDLVSERASEGRLVFSHLIPKESLAHPVFRSITGQQMVEDWLSQNMSFFNNLEDEGLKITTDQLRGFWDDVYQSTADAIHHKMKDADTLGNLNEVVGADNLAQNAHVRPRDLLDELQNFEDARVARIEEGIAEDFADLKGGLTPRQADELAEKFRTPDQIKIAEDRAAMMARARERTRALTGDLRDTAFNNIDSINNAMWEAKRFYIQIFPGIKLPPDIRLLEGSREELWELIFNLDANLNKAAVDVLENKSAQALAETASRDLILEIFDTAGFRFNFNDLGDITEMRLSVPSMAALNHQRELIVTSRMELNSISQFIPALKGQGTLGNIQIPSGFDFSRKLLVGMDDIEDAGDAVNELLRWLDIQHAPNAAEEIRTVALRRASDLADALKREGFVIPHNLTDDFLREDLRRALFEAGELTPAKIYPDTFRANLSPDDMQTAARSTDAISPEEAEAYVNQVHFDFDNGAFFSDVGGRLTRRAGGAQKGFYSNDELARRGLGVKISLDEGARWEDADAALQEAAIFQRLEETGLFPRVYNVMDGTAEGKRFTAVTMEAVDVSGADAALGRATRLRNLRKERPEIQEFIHIFLREIYHADPESTFALADDFDLHAMNVGRRLTGNKEPVLIDIPLHIDGGLAQMQERFGGLLKALDDAGFPINGGAVRAWPGDPVSTDRLEEVGEMWKAWSQASGLIDDYGEEAGTYAGFINQITRNIDELVSRGFGRDNYLVRAWSRRLNEAHEAMAHLAGFRFGGGTISPPPIPRFAAAEGIQTYVRLQDLQAGEAAGLLDLITQIKNHQIDMLDQGLLVRGAGDIPDGLPEALSNSKKEIQTVLAEMWDVINYGGEASFLPGRTFEGAVTRANRGMLDYASFSNFDAAMKNFFPFWMFPSRSIPFWFTAMMEHPEIGAFYSKYIHYSQRTLQNTGAFTTSGQPLPSLEGYVPVPGMDIWFNPTAPLSFRYIFPRATERYDPDYEDEPFWSAMVRGFVNTSQERGFSLPPWVAGILYSTNLLDENKTPRWALVPQTALLPPNWQNSLRYYLRKHAGPVERAINLFPEVSWKDFLIEREILTQAHADLSGLSYDAQIRKLKEVEQAITDREDNDLWMETRAALENEEWAQSWVAYYTGIYGKPFSEADANLMAVRTEINFLRDSINSKIGAQIFELDPLAEDRRARYIDVRYETPPGWIHNLYNTIRYVRMENGDPAFNEDRRNLIGQQIITEQENRARFSAIEQTRAEMDAALHELQIGAPYELKEPIITRFVEKLKEIDTQYNFADKPWFPGSRTPSQVMEHFQDIWFNPVASMEPDFADYDTPAEYHAAMELFLAEIPSLIPHLQNYSRAILADALQARTSQIPDDFMTALIDATNDEGYLAWKRSRDGVYEAVDNAWQVLVLDPFWESIEGLSGAARMQAEREYIRRMQGGVSLDRIYEKIVELYGDKFSMSEVERAFTGRDVLTSDQRLELDRIESQGPVKAELADAIFEFLAMPSPGDEFSELVNEVKKQGGFDDDVYRMYDFPISAWKTEDLQALHERLEAGVEALGLDLPSDAELEDRAQAQEFNDLFKAMEDFMFPGISADRAEFFNADSRREWREENPDRYENIQAAADFKDFFGLSYPVWAAYYNPEVLTDE